MLGALDPEALGPLKQPLAQEPAHPPWHTREEIHALEESQIADHFEEHARVAHTSVTEEKNRLSVAFSGGGIRAAAFQAGVLQRLADMNVLKDVDCIAAVSGGSYITAAFAAFCAEEDPPTGGGAGAVKSWYQRVVQKTRARMQENAGNFIRDCGADCCARLCPPCSGRLLDAPVLLVAFLFTVVLNLIALCFFIILPVVVISQSSQGAVMRAAFCTEEMSFKQKFNMLLWDDELSYNSWLIYSLFFCWIWGVICLILPMICGHRLNEPQPPLNEPQPPLNEPQPPTLKRLQTPKKWADGQEVPGSQVVHHGCKHLAKRLTIFLVLTMSLLLVVPNVEVASYTTEERKEMCGKYVEEAKARGSLSCTDYHGGRAWFNTARFKHHNFSYTPEAFEHSESALRLHPRSDGLGLFGPFFEGFLPIVGLGVTLGPFFGTVITKIPLAGLGPMLFFVLTVASVQYDIYGPITHNKVGVLPYRQGRLPWLLHLGCFWGPFLGLFYGEIRPLVHYYYRRCIKKSFFPNGKDIPMVRTKDNPFCPLIILTGTSTDFRLPGDAEAPYPGGLRPPGKEVVKTINEISFTALHTGSDETRFLKTRDTLGLATCTALSGAGGLDAISLALQESLLLRLIMAAFSLSWGDYIVFTPQTRLDHSQQQPQQQEHCCWVWHSWFVRLVYRIPTFVILCFIAWLLDVHANSGDCSQKKWRVFWASVVMLVVIACSFFSCVCPSLFGLLSWSPVLRLLHQATFFSAMGYEPPPMLYVTDGGVRDCTGVLQLMHRKRKRMLLVLAASDPEDDFKVLWEAMKWARIYRLGMFCDPDHPGRDVALLFEAFKGDPKKTHLHVKVSYCYGGDPDPPFGHLFIVKNRAGPEGHSPVYPVQHVGLGGAPPAPLEGRSTGDLESCTCCDCCHTCLKGPGRPKCGKRKPLDCCRSFPHGNFTGYMCLSPQWASSLMRLSYNLSEKAIEAATDRNLRL